LPRRSRQWREWDADFDADRKPWEEIEARIPPYPGTGDLVALEVSGASMHRFHVDARSLSVGEDGVVRYTLVIKVAGGATNVTFKGIHCELHQQNYYAVGRANGNWVRARNPQWRPIERQDVNRYHGVLHAEFFAPANNRSGACGKYCSCSSTARPRRRVTDAAPLLSTGPCTPPAFRRGPSSL